MPHFSFLPRLQRHASTFLRFLVAGSIGACVDFGTLLICTRLLHITVQYSFAFALCCSLIVVFLVNKYFAFQRPATSGSLRQASLFGAVYITSATLNYLVSLLLFYAGLPDYLAKVGAISILLFFNYACLHKFVFPVLSGSAEGGGRTR